MKHKERILQWGQEVLTIEADALLALKSCLNEHFIRAVMMLRRCRSRVITTGMGKAGIIAQKFSATLSSTGTPSMWLHPAEAFHGDLGRVVRGDVVVMLSYSGETEEMKSLVPFLKRIGALLIAITGNKASTLAEYADVSLVIDIKKEACPLGLAPTTSTTAMLALCDALSVTVQRIKKFRMEDFASVHPQGSLGKKLLLQVRDVMRKGKSNPIVGGQTKLTKVLLAITQARAGAASVVDTQGRLIGIFTDGDLRRRLESEKNLLHKTVKEVMTENPVTVGMDMLASEVLRILQDKKIDEVPVVDRKQHPVGMVDVQDLLKAGIV